MFENKKKADELRQLAQIEVKKLFDDDKLKHREFIERQITFLKFFFTALVLIAGGFFAFFYGRSYDDIEKKLDKTVQEIQIQYKIDEEIQNKIANIISESTDSAKKQIDNIISGTIVPETFELIQPQVEAQIRNRFDIYVSNHIDTILNTKLDKLQDLDKEEVLIPSGMISIWTKKRIPEGWIICNGKNGTPDLRDKFIFGTSKESELNEVGGKEFHNHILSLPVKSAENTNYRGNYTFSLSTEEFHAKNRLNLKTDVSSNIPPFIKLYYIMKL